MRATGSVFCLHLMFVLFIKIKITMMLVHKQLLPKVINVDLHSA